MNFLLTRPITIIVFAEACVLCACPSRGLGPGQIQLTQIASDKRCNIEDQVTGKRTIGWYGSILLY